MKLIEKIKRYKNSLLIFEHGLGDIINFIPVWEEFCKQVGHEILLGSSEKRQFYLLHKKIINVNSLNSVHHFYDFIYKISYPDSSNPSIPIEHHNEAAKPYLCAYYELGLKPFIWKPWVRKNEWFKKNSKRIGVHLFGHTGMLTKFCPENIAVQIWNEIIEAGYEPFECHMRPKWANEYKYSDRGQDYFDLVNKENSLRFEKANLKRLIEETGKCKFFIGVDSGPIYLASALLGVNNIIGLTNQKLHSHFIPSHISTVSVQNYESGTIYSIIKQKEKYLKGEKQ